MLIEFLMSAFNVKSDKINCGKTEMATFSEVLLLVQKVEYCCGTYTQTSSFHSSQQSFLLQ
jgi:hypothetical protein